MALADRVTAFESREMPATPPNVDGIAAEVAAGRAAVDLRALAVLFAVAAVFLVGLVAMEHSCEGKG